MKNGVEKVSDARASERGAALVTAMLVAMLLLAAGGALVVTTGMTATNAVDATAEAQAYYAAEAGMHSTLSVLRGNVAARTVLNLPVGVKIKNDFRTANLLATSNVADDTANGASLSGWLPYANTRVGFAVPLDTSASNRLFYKVSLSDPDDPTRTALLANSAYEPQRLIITVNGYGPKGAQKRMQLLVKRNAFDFNPPSTVLMAGNVSHFDIGDSKNKGYTGQDQSNLAAPPLPAFGFTSGGSKTSVDSNTFNCGSQHCQKASGSTGTPQTATITNSNLPAWLQTPQDAASFLDDLQAQAVSEGRYFATKSGTSAPSLGSSTDPQFTFIDGDLPASGTGAGLLVVTGELTFNGNFDFNGVVLVLGSWKDSSGTLKGGFMQRSGGGDGTISGAIVVAKFDRSNPTAFLDTYFDTNGGGKSDIVYNSSDVNNALTSMGGRVLGIVEN